MKSVLFVCVENSCRSQMAEGLFNTLAPKDFEAMSAGTNPAKNVHPYAVIVMKEIGINIGQHAPKLLTENMIRDADKIITMGCLAKDVCPAVFLPKTEDWGIENPVGQPLQKFREVREIIRARVQNSLKEITR